MNFAKCLRAPFLQNTLVAAFVEKEKDSCLTFLDVNILFLLVRYMEYIQNSKPVHLKHLKLV